MKTKNFQSGSLTQISWFLSVTLILIMTGCSSGGTIDASLSTDSSGESATGGSGASALTGLTPLTINSDNQAVIQFNDIDVTSDYVLALYSYNNSNSSYSLSVTAPNISQDAITTQALRISGLESSDNEDSTEEAHEMLRDMEANLEGDFVEAPSTQMKAVTAPLTIGSQRTFKVLQSFSSGSSYQTVTAQLQYISDDFYLYVDTRNLADVNSDKLNTALDNFDAVVASERELFGSESDVNGDGHFAILMTQAVNELGAMQGGWVSGFYFGGDVYSANSNAASNEMEIMYSFVPDPTGAHGTKISENFAFSNGIPSVLPHEFQHMISYNQHVLINKGSSETSFLGEGMSHLAEDIYSLQDGYMTRTGVENPSRVALYLKSAASTCFLCGSNIYQRGASYLFVRYLYEQAQKGNLGGADTGAELIHNLLDTNLTGLDNLLSSATGSDDDSNFDSLMSSFMTALFFSDSEFGSDDDRYAFDGINLRDAQDDNRGTNLNGPTVTQVSSLPHNVTLVSSGVTYLQVSGQSLADANGLLSVNLPSGMQGGGMVVKIN